MYRDLRHDQITESPNQTATVMESCTALWRYWRDGYTMYWQLWRGWGGFRQRLQRGGAEGRRASDYGKSRKYAQPYHDWPQPITIEWNRFGESRVANIPIFPRDTIVVQVRWSVICWRVQAFRARYRSTDNSPMT